MRFSAKTALVTALSFVSAVTSASAMVVKSTRDVDGDTVVLNSTKIRLTGIDAPEIFAVGLRTSTCPIPEKALGLKAAARTKELIDLSKHKVTVHFEKGFDRYGRRLGKVYSDGKDVGSILIAEGLALPWPDIRKPHPSFCLPTAIRHLQYKRSQR